MINWQRRIIITVIILSHFAVAPKPSNLCFSSNGIEWDKIKNDIADAYAAGKLSEQHYNLLKDKISDYKTDDD
jgi:hypothetical protein